MYKNRHHKDMSLKTTNTRTKENSWKNALPSQKRKALGFSLLTFAIMGLIFWFSSQDGDSSSAQSGWFLQFIPAWIDRDTASFLIRKLAHFSIYFLLALSMGVTLNSWNSIYSFTPDQKKILWTSLFLVFIYAGLDEWHQSYSAGRSSQFTDILIDTAGGVLACVLQYCVNTYFKK